MPNQDFLDLRLLRRVILRTPNQDFRGSLLRLIVKGKGRNGTRVLGLRIPVEELGEDRELSIEEVPPGRGIIMHVLCP